jgi:ABC-2 type transport system permease protein
MLLVIALPPLFLQHMDVPLFPRTAYLIPLLTARLTENANSPWAFIPLLIIFYAGELVWRERDAGLGEIVDAMPVPEWAFVLGKFLGLALVLAAWMALLTIAGMLVQARMGYFNVEPGLYLKVFFGIQLADYLLFAMLALVLHAVVNQKHLGYLAALLAYGAITFPSALGIEHTLLIFGSDPGWSYTDMRGFGPSLGPWLWFKLYWAAWALLLAVVAKVLWVRGREPGLTMRLRLARRRFTRPTGAVAAAAVALIISTGGFIFYNTNVLNAYVTAAERAAVRAEYGRYDGIPQLGLTGTSLRVELHPRQRHVEIRGGYDLANRSENAIDSVHVAVATATDVVTGEVAFDRPASRSDAGDDPGHRIYTLETPLQPGESMRASFDVQYAPRGFRHRGVDYSVVANGTYFTTESWLPAIGFQRAALRNMETRREMTGDQGIAFDAVIGTDADHIAIAPGMQQATWMENGRRYFRYAEGAPTRNRHAIFSAEYAVRETKWNDVTIQIFHDPRHATNVDRIVRGAKASLSYHSERFGPYPHRYLRFVERPISAFGMHAEAANIEYYEGFSMLNASPQGADLPFTVAAHEVAHQWWGHQFMPAPVAGGILMGEGLAVYSSMRVVEKTDGQEQLRRYIGMLRSRTSEFPSTRSGVPLLWANSWFDGYRKGPFALYTLGQFIGEERVNEALKRLFDNYQAGVLSMPMALDLYGELQAVTPPEMQSLVQDLFSKNTFWDLETKRATAKQTGAGTWQVTLDVRARKVAVDEAGVETPAKLDDLMEVGIFARSEKGDGFEPIYQQKHRINAAEQTITVTVPRQPARAGIDPQQLFTSMARDDWHNQVIEVTIEQ